MRVISQSGPRPTECVEVKFGGYPSFTFILSMNFDPGVYEDLTTTGRPDLK